MAIKDRLIQFILRGRDEMSPEVKKATEAVEELSEEATRLGGALDNAKSAQGLGLALERVRRDVGLAQRSLDQAERQVVDLREALNKNPDAAGLQQSLKDSEREANRARRTLNALEAQLTDAERAAHGAGIDVHNLSDEQRRLGVEVDRARTAVRDNNQVLQQARRDLAAASRAAAEHTSRLAAVRDGMARGARQVLGYAAAYVSLNAAFGLVQKGLNLVRDGINSMLDTGDQFELLGKRMASLMGSVAEGERATAWIKTFAKDTPLELAEVSEAFALLKSYGLDPMDGSLQAIVDKNEQLGGGMERLQGISSALGQAYAKQKLQTEEILQLVERGVPVWSMLEKITGKNAATLQELATKGRLGRDVIAALIKEMGQSAQGAAAEGMGTLTGLVSNLRDTWSDFLDRIAKSGALEYAKQQLKDVADNIDRMDKDGRLDKLASALSKAFTEGAEKVKGFAVRLLDVDFDKLADDSTRWLNGMGEDLDKVIAGVDTFTEKTRTFWNVLTLAGNSADAFWGAFKLGILETASMLASTLPDALGGSKWKEQIDQMAAGVRAGIKTSIDGVVTDFSDLRDSVAGMGKDAVDTAKAGAKETTEAIKSELEQQRMLDQAHADQLVATQHKVRDEAIAAAVAGTAAIEGIGNALSLIDTARTAEQLEGLRRALLSAYQAGILSQQEYAQATGVLNGRLKELGSNAGGAANLVSDLEEKLADLASVQAAISNAKTDVDINAIKKSLRELYEGGKITAQQYNQELQKTAERQKELKAAVGDGAKAQRDKNQAEKEAIVTSEQLRRESGKRMEAERQAGDEAMQRRRKESSDARQDMGAMEGFFGGVMTRVREPLAQMSQAALDAFNKLRGLSSVDMGIDTSDLDATTASLQRVNKALGEISAAQAENTLMSSLGKWSLEMQRNSLQTQQGFLQQKRGLQDLMASYNRGSLTLSQFIAQASSARRTMNLLDESDLGSLESAIQSAKQQMQSMADSTRSTLDSLQDELDQLEGKEDAIAQRRFANRKKELQAQLAEAQSTGSQEAIANAQRAIGLLRDVEEATSLQRQQQEQAKRVEASKQAQANQPVPRQLPARVIRLESSRGQVAQVAVDDEASETALISILEDAAGRAL
ncbi:MULTISPECIES: tape measure protein [unclassified Pseudomonas]|uniref:tape measure protein n=1 Tax=unclassified Pseudomonas TaxID=196821 RepID=UPI00244ABC06|nr:MULTISPECIES: tape measure protein [unclassified Pseudomonas]MDG9928257.1 tape measure protein [Pseudomonas sp. GD04042]MDH0481179.1 tape measure protein [Pseudomonas sp. GD04015]MDH0604515.1 tape measure protein [Pseudomonas sp. GD03869]